MILSDERQTAWASTPTSLLINRPFRIEWSRTSDELELETTIPRSELTQQQITSPRWPRRECMGPSIRRLLLLSTKEFIVVLLLLAEVEVPEPVDGSDALREQEVDAL